MKVHENKEQVQKHNGWWIVVCDVKNDRHQIQTTFYIKPIFLDVPSDSAYSSNYCMSGIADGYPSDSIEKAEETIDECHRPWVRSPVTVEEYAELVIAGA